MDIVERNLKSYNADTQGLEFFGPITSVAGLVTRISVALTNAQILTLPTTRVALVAAPGVGSVLVAVRAIWSIDASAGAYTNVDATAALFLGYGGSVVLATNAAPGTGTITVAQKSIFLANGILLSTVLSTTPEAQTGVRASFDNIALQIAATNGALGNFTGGNVANAGTVTVDFLTETP